MPKLEILKSGFFSTIQDAGRPGYRHLGIPVSGVMDDFAYRLANRLVGNKEHAPVIEMTLKGLQAVFHDDAAIAVTGAPMNPTINGDPVPQYRRLEIKKGDHLKFKNAEKGCRCYIAIQGNWEIEKILGSYSTFTPAKFGGFKGRCLQKGDIIRWREFSRQKKYDLEIEPLIPYYSGKLTLRMLPGPEWEMLNKEQQHQFLNEHFSVSSRSNRMGIRLDSTLPDFNLPEIKSAPVLTGTVQYTNESGPIILMKDGQSVGGYPRIAQVTASDIWRAGQLAPNNKVLFKMISLTDAIQLKRHQDELLNFDMKK